MSGRKTLVALGGVLVAVALVGCAPNNSGVTKTSAGGPAQEPTASASTESAAPPALPSPQQSGAVAGIQVDRLIAKSVPQMGKVVTDGKGWILYRFDSDTAKPEPKSACEGNCAKVWPPALTDGNPQLEGIAPEAVGTLTRADGSKQLTIGGWALYRYTGDEKPGQWKGQGVGGTWFVVAPDGKKNTSCLPTTTPTPVAPPADPPASSSGSQGGY